MWQKVMRINTLSYGLANLLFHSLLITLLVSVFLAVKYGSLAMLKPNPSVGKHESGGSIILTASGRPFVSFVWIVWGLTYGQLPVFVPVLALLTVRLMRKCYNLILILLYQKIAPAKLRMVLSYYY